MFCKAKWIAIAIIAAISILGYFANGYNTAHAGILDDIRTAITGHVKDAKSRFTNDQVIESMFSVSTGTFNEDASGQDFAHWAKGTVSIVQNDEDGKFYVQLHSDFNSGPLPDGYVYLSALDKDIDNESDFNKSRQVKLGPLKKGKGASFYEIPNHIPASLVKSVTVWCEAFSEYIGSANVN